MTSPAKVDHSGTTTTRAQARHLQLETEDGAGGANIHAGTVSWAGHEVRTMPFDVTLSIDVNDQGEVLCTGIELRQKPGGPAVTARSVQSARVGRLIGSAVKRLTEVYVAAEDGSHQLDWMATFELQKVPHRLAYKVTQRKRTRSRLLTAGDHKKTANAWRRAKKAGRSTTAEVRAAFPDLLLSAAAARWRVAAARSAGYLAPAGGTTRP